MCQNMTSVQKPGMAQRFKHGDSGGATCLWGSCRVWTEVYWICRKAAVFCFPSEWLSSPSRDMGAMQQVLLSQQEVKVLQCHWGDPRICHKARILTQELHLSCASVHDPSPFECGRELPVFIPYISSLPPSPRLCHFFRIATDLYFSYTSSVDSNTHSIGVYLPKTHM